MTNQAKRLAPVAIAALLFSVSCTEVKTNTAEQAEIQQMDSTAAALKETQDKLEDQTKKVEASIEKLDNEFQPSN